MTRKDRHVEVKVASDIERNMSIVPCDVSKRHLSKQPLLKPPPKQPSILFRFLKYANRQREKLFLYFLSIRTRMTDE